MEQETKERLSRTEFEALCQEACEWMTPDVPEGERNRRLKNYLLKREFSSVETGEEFLGRYISTIFS